MVTINEAAKSHEYNKEKNSISSIINKSTISSFKAGVEFAQKWISIEDELPENDTDYVLFKNNYGDISIGLCKKIINLWVDNTGKFIDENQITHWRPIEFK